MHNYYLNFLYDDGNKLYKFKFDFPWIFLIQNIIILLGKILLNILQIPQ